MMIVDIKTALDRYLTHSLARTLDRQSFDFFCCYADDPTAHYVQKNATGRARTTEKSTPRSKHEHTTLDPLGAKVAPTNNRKTNLGELRTSNKGNL